MKTRITMQLFLQRATGDWGRTFSTGIWKAALGRVVRLVPNTVRISMLLVVMNMFFRYCRCCSIDASINARNMLSLSDFYMDGHNKNRNNGWKHDLTHD